jgi:hypothetical protein
VFVLFIHPKVMLGHTLKLVAKKISVSNSHLDCSKFEITNVENFSKLASMIFLVEADASATLL